MSIRTIPQIAALALVLCNPLAHAQTAVTTAGMTQRTPAAATSIREFEPIPNVTSTSGAGKFNAGLIFLADQLDRNSNVDVRKRITVITSFANLNDLGESSSFGRLVGENLLHEMQVRNWAVSDLRLSRSMVINEAGEFSLSRDIKRVREALPAGQVLTGTYTDTADGVLLSARIIDLATGEVVSTAQTRFARDRFVAGLIDKPRALPVIALTR